ncbi:amino acid adenylation domain-containing protein, partial [bacterium JGI 053]
MHRLFAEQAARTPDAVVLAWDGGTLTFAELDAAASRLARLLRRRGVAAGGRVGFCLERGPEVVVTMLAALKAGAAYVPLDAAYPAERLAFMLADSGMRTVVTSRRLLPVLPAGGVDVLVLDEAADALRAEPPTDPGIDPGPEALAYVIYTSGSTGRPKGVAVPHRGIVRLVRGGGYADLGPEQVFLQLSSISFDTATLEVWAPLLNGGRLAVYPPAPPTPRELGEVLRRHGVTTLWLTSGVFGLCADEDPRIFSGLRQLLAGGDVLSVPHVRRVARANPSLRLINGYGPTENTTFTTCHTVRPADLEGTSLPIGTAVGGTTAWVVDAAMRPCGLGELLTGGEGLAWGYLGRPALTAERWIPDPFSSVPGARLYRTGDQVRRREDGALDFLGRIDQQVKIRGFRIELGEVEAVLREQAGVGDAAVAAHPDGRGEKRLVGYVVGHGGAPPAAAALREAMARRLPAHMVPALFVALDALPLSPNGKVDRRALPAPPERPDEIASPAVAPRTETEAQVAAIWAEVLGVSGVGVEDDVFLLGAHSLAVTQVASRLRGRMQVELSLADLFAAPTVAGTAAAIERRRREGAAQAAPPVVPVARGGRLPLSFSQERVWFLIQLAPDNLSYNFQASLTLRGALDPAALRAALAEIVRRHEVFRTTFPAENGRPYQEVHAPWEVELPLQDLSGLAPAERAAEEGRILREAFARAYDLTRLPLVGWLLLRRAADEHVLVHREHHIVHDGWSFNVFLGELLALYGAFAAGRPSPLAEPALQFGDYAAWQRRWMEGEAARGQLAFWRERLAGSTPVLELPHDRPRPVEQRFRGAAPRFELPPELYARLRAAARRDGVTLFATMTAAFGVLLSRWSGQPDLNLGTGIANRRQGETQALIGMFVNSVVVRVALDDDPPFAALARRVHAQVLAAADHQELPFEALVDALRPARSLGHNPLFQAMFSFHDSPVPELRLPGLEVEVVPGLSNGSAKFDLNVIAIPRAEQRVGQGRVGEADGITLVWEYSSDLFDAATIEAMVRQYRTLLEAVAAEAGTRVSRLPLAGPEERQALVAAGLATRAFPVAERIDRRFARMAAERPEAPAVTCGAETLSYGGLNLRANRLAHRLAALGVRPGTRVGLCLERSIDLVAAVLGVLKAGGAYVPVDPGYPAERIAFVLRDAEVPVLVTQSALLARLAGHAAATVCMDVEEAAGGRADDPAVEAGPDAPAYVIYTSGSTGRPKGVEVTHANVMRLFDATDGWFGFGADDVWTLFHSCAFDFSVWESWGALLYGGRLVVVPFLTTRSPDDFHRLLVDEGVTVLSQTPSAFRQLAQASLASGVDPCALALRHVVFGGEALDPRWLRPWIDRYGDERPRLVNMYGITETTVHVTYRPITRADLEGGGSPIGVPIPDLALHLLDAHLEPVPPCVPGELCVGGAGVARGYLGRPELTAQRFVRDPFSADPAARLYRSGDRARRRADGELEYLGRADQQVKVRGFRVETGEVEAALAAHPAVADAAVALHGGAAGDGRLVAYVVAAAGTAAPAAGELRAHLAASLPEHMLPAAFVALEALPLTANGKLDRRALPAPGAVESGEAYAPPRTPVEAALAAAWSEVLGVERVGIDDNYFALGGDSIRTVRVVARARARGVAVTLPQLFQLQTIRLLAGAADASAALAPGECAEPLAPFALVADEVRRRLPAGVEDAYPPTQLQLGMLYHSELDPGSVRYHNVAGYRLETAWDEEALRAAVRHVSRRHPVLRTSFELGAYPEPLQLVHAEAGVPLGVDDLRHLPPEAQEAALDAWMREEMERPFDRSVAPLARFHAHRLEDGAFRFSLTEHHAVLDGWSTASLLTELFRHYVALRDGTQDLTGEAPRLGFGDFVALERRALASEETRGWWARALDGAETTFLPRGDAPRAVETRGAASHAAELSAGASEALKRLAARAGVPLKSVLLAAHLRVLALLGGREQVLTGLVANGRPEAADGERILGLFLNTVPLVARVEGGSWLELVRAAFAAEREMLPHRRFPLAQAQRLAGRAPLVDVAFNYIHFHVYDDLLATGGIAFQGAKFLQETEFSLVTNFYTDLHGGRVRFRLDYDPAAMGAAEAAVLAGRYARALAAMAEDAGAPIAATDLLSAAERAGLLARGTGDEVAGAAPTLATLFAAQAERTPHALALVAGAERLDYAALRRRADRLARRLRAAGVGRACVVGVCAPRSAELAVGVLGTLGSGGVYLPLDAAYPPERLAYLLADSGARVVVTTTALADRLPAGPALVLLDADDGAPLPELMEEVRPEDAAYLIYTSGSTGAPKGVAVRHGEAAAHCAAAVEAFGLSANDVVLHFASASFDVSLEQLLPPFAVGARVVLRGDEVPTPAELAALLRREGVTVVNPPTAYWHQLVADPASRAAMKQARLVIGGGDVMHPDALRAWDEAEGSARLLNAYGPTEAVITAAAFEVPAGFRGERVPVGRPFPGRRLYVTGAAGELLPAGVPGELCIGGPLLARGYLGRPRATAQRFVADPFADAPGARMYRTGDRARWVESAEVRECGSALDDPRTPALPHSRTSVLEFLGRLDGQVKVRGYRIELGEVEAALRAHPDVADAVAAVREEEPGRTVLAAYAVPRAGAALSAAGLRAFLARRLPAHAVPTAFAVLDALPLTPNGKVDRAALPAAGGVAGEAAYAAPRTPAEELLASLWAEALGAAQVGIHDDFFALGGHSLLATRLVARVRELFRVELPLRALFDAPTVAALAERVEMERRGGAPLLPPLRPRGETGRAPLSFAQRRLWFLDRMEPGRAHYNLPAVVRLRGTLDAGALERSLAALVARHEALRTVFRAEDGGEPAQVVLEGAGFRLSIADLAHLPAGDAEAEALRRVEADVRRPFDLADGPLFRACLVRAAADDHLLAVTLHHAVGDAWSLRLLFGELSALYGAFARGEGDPLPPPALRYADYAAGQRAWLTGERLEGQVAWWRAALAGAPPTLALPTDRPRPGVQRYRGAIHRFELDGAAARGVRALARRGGATPFMALLAAFQALLSRWSGQDDVVVGVPVAGRAQGGSEGIVGLFVNTLPVRGDLSGDPSFRTLLGRVRESVLGGLAHQDVPFEKLVEELRPERTLGRQPLFQAVFAYNHASAADLLVLADASAAPVPVDGGTAKFDLTLGITERGDALSAGFEYATDLFDAATVEAMAGHLRALLAAAAADPDAPVSLLPLVDAAERARLLALGAAAAPAQETGTLHERFASRAARTPHAVAITCED